MYNAIELGTSGIPIWLLFAPILIPTLHSSMLQDPWTVSSRFRRNSGVSYSLVDAAATIAIIDAAACQSYHQRRCPPKLSLIPPPAEGITNDVADGSYHQCCCPPKLALIFFPAKVNIMPPPAKTIIIDCLNYPRRLNKEKEQEQENRT